MPLSVDGFVLPVHPPPPLIEAGFGLIDPLGCPRAMKSRLEGLLKFLKSFLVPLSFSSRSAPRLFLPRKPQP